MAENLQHMRGENPVGNIIVPDATLVKYKETNVANTLNLIETEQETQNVHLATLDETVDTLAYGENSGGENLWDEKWEVGQLNPNSGNIVSSTDQIVSTHYIRVKPNTKYISVTPAPLRICYYNANKVWLSYVKLESVDEVFTTPSDAYYIRFFPKGGYGTTYNNDIAIFEYEEGKSYTYKPYIKSAKMLTSAVDTIGTTTNLLNPTAQSRVTDGVIFTNNEDGTYTVTGSLLSSKNYVVLTIGTVTLPSNQYKLVGTSKGNGYYLNIGGTNLDVSDFGDGVIFNYNGTANVHIVITTHDSLNLTFKPMITTNLQATYDDFVPYTGSTGKLNSDVAEINNDLSEKQNKVRIGTFVVGVTANVEVEITSDNIISGEIPPNQNTCFTPYGVSATRKFNFNIFYDANKLYAYSDKTQNIYIRWFNFS